MSRTGWRHAHAAARYADAMPVRCQLLEYVDGAVRRPKPPHIVAAGAVAATAVTTSDRSARNVATAVADDRRRSREMNWYGQRRRYARLTIRRDTVNRRRYSFVSSNDSVP